MKYLLILMVVLMGWGSASAQTAPDSLTLDSLAQVVNVDLGITDLQVFLCPCDSTACHQAMQCHNPDSALYNHLSSGGGHSHAIIRVKVKNENLIHRLHLKAGRSQGATHFIQRQLPFQTIQNPPAGVLVTRIESNTLEIKIDRCLNAIPFFLEAWLEDNSGQLSPIETFTIQ